MEITEELLDDFRGYMKKQNLSPNTVTAYVGSVRLFLNMFDEVTPDNLRKYRTTLISRYKPATVNQRIFAVNYYIDFLVEHHLEDHLDLVDYHLTSVKIQKKSFQDAVISNEDYELLKCRLKEDGNEFWYFVVHFLASTGARVSELVKIKVEHNHYHYNRMFCNWASSETNRKTMCVLAGIIAVLAIAMGVMLYWYFHSPQYAIKLYHDVKTHPRQVGDIKNHKDFVLDQVYKFREEDKLDDYIDSLEEAKKELNQDKLIWWW